MLEAEIKIEIDGATADRLRAALRDLGATAKPARRQEDVYFAHPDRDFASTDEALRLRQDEGRLRITYKGPKLDPPRKTREEIEFPLETDVATARALLERLGFTAVATVTKSRTELVLAGPPPAIVSLDEISGLGTFCEIEVEAETVSGGRDALTALAERLDVADHAPIAASYLELLLRRGAASGSS